MLRKGGYNDITGMVVICSNNRWSGIRTSIFYMEKDKI